MIKLIVYAIFKDQLIMRLTTSTLPSFLCAALVLSSPVSADFVGLNIGTKHWVPDMSGSFSSSTDSSIRLSDDLGYKDEATTALTISIEHPIPAIPNVKYQGYDLNSSSASNISNSITFDGTSYTGDINSQLDLSHNELVLYYELLDNWVNLDMGLDLKKFDGKVSITDNVNRSIIDVDETIPMLYLSARFNLPLSGFYVGADIHPLSIGDNSAEDSSLMIGYESKRGLGIEGGIKSFSLELDDANDLNTNLEYDGLYLNGYLHF